MLSNRRIGRIGLVLLGGLGRLLAVGGLVIRYFLTLLRFLRVSEGVYAMVYAMVYG